MRLIHLLCPGFSIHPVLVMLIALSQQVSAQDGSVDANYQRVTLERASKIVETLKLEDHVASERVAKTIAEFYQNLNALHAERDHALKKLTDSSVADTKSIQGKTKEQIQIQVDAMQSKIHYALIARLGSELNAEQIDKIKDGLTYRVVPNTYQHYLELYPSLNSEQRREILAMLLEAREFAMDAGSSKEKHAWFGKYKGRINNYLSKAGFDAKEAERVWKEKQTSKPVVPE